MCFLNVAVHEYSRLQWCDIIKSSSKYLNTTDQAAGVAIEGLGGGKRLQTPNFDRFVLKTLAAFFEVPTILHDLASLGVFTRRFGGELP